MLGRLTTVRCLLPARPTSDPDALGGWADAAAGRIGVCPLAPSRGDFPDDLPFAVLFLVSS